MCRTFHVSQKTSFLREHCKRISPFPLVYAIDSIKIIPTVYTVFSIYHKKKKTNEYQHTSHQYHHGTKRILTLTNVSKFSGTVPAISTDGRCAASNISKYCSFCSCGSSYQSHDSSAA